MLSNISLLEIVSGVGIFAIGFLCARWVFGRMWGEAKVPATDQGQTLRNLASVFLGAITQRCDEHYKSYIQVVSQELVSNGIDDSSLGRVLNDERTKLIYFIGMCSEQLLASRNLLGNDIGIKFEIMVFDAIGERVGDIYKKLSRYLVDVMRENPVNSRVAMLDVLIFVMVLDNEKVYKSIFRSVIPNFLTFTALNSTILCEGGGVLKQLLEPAP